MIPIALVLAATCTLMEGEPPRKGYLYRVTVSINQFLNTLTGGNPDETLSSRWGRAKKRGSKSAKVACSVLSAAMRGRCHCEQSIEYDESGKARPHQLPEDK